MYIQSFLGACWQFINLQLHKWINSYTPLLSFQLSINNKLNMRVLMSYLEVWKPQCFQELLLILPASQPNTPRGCAASAGVSLASTV